MARPPLPARLVLPWLALLLAAPVQAADPGLPDGLYAEFGTPRGTIVCELHHHKAPLTVASFVGLAEGKLGPAPRRPYFDGLTFHRVVPDFVIQGGDPTGTGDGGPGYTFPDEFVPGLRHEAAGILSMANKGPDTNGSQFFLTLRETNRLNYLHSVFGRVVRGLEVLPKIQRGDKMTVKILRLGAAARAFRADEGTVKELAARTRKYTALPEPGPAAHFDDPSKVLPLEPPRARYFNFKLANFERTTGRRILARIHPKSPTAAEDAQPGAFMRSLAEKLGTARDGALAVYFVDDDSWRIWVGDTLTSQFAGKPGTAAELTKSGAIHDVKEALLEAAQARGNADFKQQQETLAAAKQPPPPPGQRVKLQADAVLDSLIFKLEPR
ncbi:MAG: peptidylprolyl isomerase [Verrucomicrobia bacterium]|nr:peptidylprolyl isomerase [Verrucomicrobiota bacterium]